LGPEKDPTLNPAKPNIEKRRRLGQQRGSFHGFEGRGPGLIQIAFLASGFIWVKSKVFASFSSPPVFFFSTSLSFFWFVYAKSSLVVSEFIPFFFFSSFFSKV
jgi:hypothetical protein